MLIFFFNHGTCSTTCSTSLKQTSDPLLTCGKSPVWTKWLLLPPHWNLEKLNKRKRNKSKSSSLKYAVQGLQVQHKHFKYSGAGRQRISERETFGTNPILIYPTGSNLVTDFNLNPHTEIHMRLWASTINTTGKGRSKSITILQAILWSTQILLSSPHYITTRVFKANTTQQSLYFGVFWEESE